MGVHRPQRLRVPFVARVVVHWRRRRAYEYRAARVLQQVLQQRYLDRRPVARGPTAVFPAVVVLVLVLVLLLRQRRRLLLLLLLRRMLLRRMLLLRWRHRALARRTVRQVVRYEFLRFRVHVSRASDADPAGVVDARRSAAAAPAAVTADARLRVLQCGLRRRLVLVPFQYGLGPPALLRRTVYRLGRHRRRGLAAFACIENNRHVIILLLLLLSLLGYWVSTIKLD